MIVASWSSSNVFFLPLRIESAPSMHDGRGLTVGHDGTLRFYALERGEENTSQVIYSNGLTWLPGYGYQPLRCKCEVTAGRDAPVSGFVSLGVTSTARSAA